MVRRCPICNHYLTLSQEYNDCRCLNPGHWIAAGQLAPNDFYELARMVALARWDLRYPESPQKVSAA